MPFIVDRVPEKKTTGICEFCGKEATLLCDMPAEQVVISMKSIYSNTCDKEMCKECSTKFRKYDFCPSCMRELRDIWNAKIKKEVKV